jgi:predicted AAA+ superfamily ATPase
LLENVTETLAGRAAMLRLMPLSRREEEGRPWLPLPWEVEGLPPAGMKEMTYRRLWQGFLRGGYPELAASPERDTGLWLASYVQTYLERDVRSIRQIGDLSLFRNFLRVIAARSAQLLNLSDVARDLGVAVNTVKSWLSVLEATYQVVVLRPYFANIGKRLVKSPKVYFTDVGILCHLTGLKDPEHAASGPMGGAIMETAVLAEITRTMVHRGMEPRIYFWRTTAGTEVDFVVETEGRLVPIEVKVSATPRPAMTAALKTFRRDFAARAGPGYLVHPGDTTLPLGDGITALPLARL